jgi:hypothetical protein
MFVKSDPDRLDSELSELEDYAEKGLVIGLLVNEVPADVFARYVIGNHWYALAQDISLKWTNRDSKLQIPMSIREGAHEEGSLGALIAYVRNRARNHEAQIFVVSRLNPKAETAVAVPLM